MSEYIYPKHIYTIAQSCRDAEKNGEIIEVYEAENGVPNHVITVKDT